MRVYVPATWPMLRTMVKNGILEPIGGTAFALTPRLRESYASGDDEELEYAALNEAARASLRLLAVEFGLGEDSTPARRVVVAADLTDVTLRPDLDDGAVRITARLPVEDLATLFDVELPRDDDVETVGGLLARELGVVPIEGSQAEVAGLRLVAESTGGRRNRIDTILVCRVPEDEESAESEEPQADRAATSEASTSGATASGATASGAAASGAAASGATRVEQPAGAVEG